MSLAITSYPALPAHYDTRPTGMVIEAVVIHRLAVSLPAALAHLTGPTTGQVRCSWHYTIACGGMVMQHIADDKRAWHVGASNYAGRSDWDDFSIGIVLLGRAEGGYTMVQHTTLAELLDELAQRHPLQPEYVVGYNTIASPPHTSAKSLGKSMRQPTR